MLRYALALGALCVTSTSASGQHYEGISATMPTGAATISTDGLVASYDMETRTEDGRLCDFSGNAHHGTFTSADPIDAVEDRIALTSHPDLDLDGTHTIAVWVRIDELGHHQHIFACDDKWALWVTPDDQFRLGDTRGGGWSMTEGSAPRGRWLSVVSILRGTAGDPLTPDNVSLYVNGELADASRHLRTNEARELATWNPGALYAEDACYIGFESHQGMESHQTMPFFGAVDEVLLFSRAWTEDEVRSFASREVE